MLSKVALIKAIGGLLVGGGIIGGGVAYALNSNSPAPKIATIKEKITKGGKRTILDINLNGWDIKLHTYKNLKTKVGTNINSDSNLKDWCTTTLDSQFENEEDQNYLQAQQVCTTPTNKEKLLKEKKELATESEWQARATAYATEGIEDKVIPELKGKKNPTKKEIEDWCTSELEKEIKNNYDLTVKWCTKTGK